MPCKEGPLKGNLSLTVNSSNPSMPCTPSRCPIPHRPSILRPAPTVRTPHTPRTPGSIPPVPLYHRSVHPARTPVSRSCPSRPYPYITVLPILPAPLYHRTAPSVPCSISARPAPYRSAPSRLTLLLFYSGVSWVTNGTSNQEAVKLSRSRVYTCNMSNRFREQAGSKK